MNKEQSVKFILDGLNCRNKESFFKEITSTLFFPDYWQPNLDSLDELLNDLDWIDESIIIIEIKNSEHFLEKEPVELKKKVIQLLNNVVKEWENFENENFRERKKVIIDFVN